MSAYVDLAGELIDIGRNGLKLCEVGTNEAITREKLTHRNKDDTNRFSIRIISEIIDEFDVIATETGDSMTKIASGVALHGLSIVWNTFEKFIVDIEDARMKVMCSENEVICRLASSTNTSTYSVYGHTTLKTIVIPDWGTGHIAKVAKTLFINSSTLYQVCMAYSLFTRDDISGYRRKKIMEIVSGFFDHVYGQYMLFRALGAMVDSRCCVPTEHQVNFDNYMKRVGMVS
jgi:hypothetical protein